MTTAETSVHKEIKSSQIKSSEEGVTNVKDAVMGFTNPFTVENKEELYCLSSGLPASSEVSNNLLQAKEQGQSAMAQFIKERLIDKTVKFHDPIKYMKYKAFTSMEKCQKDYSSQKKLVEVRAERNIFAHLIMLSLKNDIDLEMTMPFQLGPVPWTLATKDGCPVKTDKAKLLHNLEAHIDPSEEPPLEDSVYACDGNAFLQALTAIPETFEDVAERVFALLSKTKQVDFVTECYHENSVKSFERCRRSVAFTVLLSGPKTKTPRDWKLFMSNDENQTQLMKLLLSEWRRPKYDARLDGRRLFFVCGEEHICLTSNNGILVETRP